MNRNLLGLIVSAVVMWTAPAVGTILTLVELRGSFVAIEGASSRCVCVGARSGRVE